MATHVRFGRRGNRSAREMKIEWIDDAGKINNVNDWEGYERKESVGRDGKRTLHGSVTAVPASEQDFRTAKAVKVGGRTFTKEVTNASTAAKKGITRSRFG